jgi:enoyl-CoA hydratase/carnithine racemase
MPGIGGTQQLGRLLNKNMAMYYCMTGEPITAQQIKSWGSALVF